MKRSSSCSSSIRVRRAEEEMKMKMKMKMKKLARSRSRLQIIQFNATSLLLFFLLGAQVVARSEGSNSGLRYEPESNAYTGLTFTFDPRLDKRVEWLHSEHWLSIMQHTSAMLYEALNGRAYLPEVRVLIPYKWRSYEWPGLLKPGSPIIMNRRLRYSDSDVLVGFEDPVYKETPYAIQHDECAKQGLHIHMPISFLEQNQLDSRLKARLLLREFASHRYGIFKESGFRYDYMYPIFPSLPGLLAPGTRKAAPQNTPKQSTNTLNLALINLEGEQQNQTAATNREQLAASLRGFDHNWNECSFDTDPSTGLPAAHALTCAPYLTKIPPNNQVSSFNLMNADPFSYANLSSQMRFQQQQGSGIRPLEWRQLGPDSVKWHLCGENFASASPSVPSGNNQATNEQATNSKTQAQIQVSFAHNQLASNKQNEMCNERSAMDVIRSSEDFRRNQFSPSNFNRLPDTNFKFLQEMPPRLVLCVEYAAHLYQAKRLEHGILEAAIGKFLAYDLIADSEMALVLFGLHHSTRTPFKKLDSSVDARLTLYSPALDPYEEPAKLFTEQELAQLGIQPSTSSDRSAQALPLKGTCSFGRALAEASAAISSRTSYEDVGADLVMITSGLFVEDEQKIEEILRSYPAVRADGAQQLSIIIYPSAMLLDSGLIVGLDGPEAEEVIKYRVNKLLLIQRITGAKIHLVREQLDSSGNVRMSTLLQFHQVFEHLARGHSWEQTDSIMTLNQRLSVDSRRTFEGNAGASGNGSSFITRHQEQHKLTYQFEVDDSVQEELIVGFVEPKQTSSHSSLNSLSSTRTGKRFALKQLQLRSPGGQLILQSEGSSVDATSQLDSQLAGESADGSENLDRNQLGAGNGAQESGVISETIHTLFPYRAQLNLAGFHLRSHQLAPLKGSKRLAGVWTLTATADEPLQASALAMARANPSGDTLNAHCWIQTYSHQAVDSPFLSDPLLVTDHQTTIPATGILKSVKVFVQVRGAAQAAIPEVVSRIEVEDESGSIVQNNKMLDDGLGTPDMTRADGIHSQYVRRANKPGFYRVRVELSAPEGKHASNTPYVEPVAVGQDQTCCGSFMGTSSSQRRDSTRHVSRLVYCGTFYSEPGNKLAQQRPTRPANLSVVGVDQERRRVSLRWFESVGQLDPIVVGQPQLDGSQINDLNSGNEPADQQAVTAEQQSADGRALLLSGARTGPHESLLGGRYEIKLFTDRDALRRAFDAKPEVGLRFSEWHVEGPLPNSSSPTGQRDLTLRIPSAREGIYYLAIRIHHPQSGLSSTISRPAHFWLRAGNSAHQASGSNGDLNDLLGLSGNSLDLEDPSGAYELQQRGLGQFLPRAGPLDGASLLILVSLMALLFSLLCVSLIACLAGSARRSLGARLAGKHQQHQKRKDGSGKQVASSSSAAAIMSHTGSGSSSVASSRNDSTSNCGASELNSSLSSSGSQCGGNQLVGETAISSKMSLVEELGYPLELGPPQAQARGVHMMDRRPMQQQQQQQSMDGSNNWLQHTLVNGYAYATVAPNQLQQKQHQQQQQPGELNQDGLSAVQSWPADILLSHYDKVRQARERKEAPPVMRVETLEGKQSYNGNCMDGLGLPPPLLDSPGVNEDLDSDQVINQQQQQQKHQQQSYLLRQQQRPLPGYFNLQLQQQLSSVLRQRAPNQNGKEQGMNCNELLVGNSPNGSCSPALEGVLELRSDNVTDPQQLQYAHLPVSTVEQPPQYVYCTTNSSNSTVQSPLDQTRNHSTLHPMISEPSIYSQVTNLQQVGPQHQQQQQQQQQQQSYYANQWQPNNSNNNIYSQAPQYNQYLHHQQQLNQRDDYHVLGTSEQQVVNSAISEV